MHRALPGDYHSLSLTQIQFHPPKVVPLTNFAEVAVQGSAAATLTPENGTTEIKVVIGITDQLILQKKVKVKSSITSPPVENLATVVGQLSTTSSNANEVAHGQLPVAVDHSQLRVMASETVDPIDWPLPLTLYRAVPPELPPRYQCGYSGY